MYSVDLEGRIDRLTVGWILTKKKMFGALAYCKEGKMYFSIRGKEILIHVDEEASQELQKVPGVHTAVMGQRVMKNWLQAGSAAIAEDDQLRRLLEASRASAEKS